MLVMHSYERDMLIKFINATILLGRDSRYKCAAFGLIITLKGAVCVYSSSDSLLESMRQDVEKYRQELRIYSIGII